MPNLEPVIAQQDAITLRHVGPKALVWPAPPVAVQEFAVLSQSTMVARELPVANVPGSPDFVSGSWTGRLGDAGEAQLLFPNATSSDGTPWRTRFDPTGHLQFVEVYFNGLLDAVGVIDQATPDLQQITVHAFDAWWLLKKAYVRDWIVTLAPRDVIERGTQVWVPAVADNFASGTIVGSQLQTPNETWTTTTTGGTVAFNPGGGVNVNVNSPSNSAGISCTRTGLTATQTWSATVSARNVGSSGGEITVTVQESNGNQYSLNVAPPNAGNSTFDVTFSGPAGAQIGAASLPIAASYSFTLESDGEWVFGYCNGQLVGCARRYTSTGTTSLELSILGSFIVSFTILGALLESLQPFLQRGSDKGDYVLPGNASTYPSGGLHARYFNDLDLQADANRLAKILAPNRTQAYGSQNEYVNQQDPQINGQSNPTPGAAGSNWSCVWFGAIYLKLSAGDYQLGIILPSGGTSAYRIWIGKTRLGEEVAGNWGWNTPGSSAVFSVSSAALAGKLPYGAGTVARDGWYPIKIEFAVDSAAALAPALYLEYSPVAYTDPGGTAIPAGTQPPFTLVPATSLSPLGCVDQRYQGLAHFDLVQQTVQAFGYQAAVEPQQLESGLFPGVLAPRIREGHDSDLTLEPDTGPRTDGEGILNYSSTLDSSDFASSLQGNGAGFQSGTTGQLQANVYDPATMLASLFDAQAWQDFSDASFTSLLQALLNSQLGLQLEPWQLLSADPNGRPRKAFTWPLTGALQNMRWRPGDGLRIKAPLINVNDTTPRQMLVVTRNITPFGITGTQATFANRPKNPARALKRQLYTATRLQRNYQRQLVTLSGGYQFAQTVAAGSGTNPGPWSLVALSPGDLIVRARLRISSISGTSPSIGVSINASDATSTLNGPWSVGPLLLDITAVARPDSQNRLYATIINEGANSVALDWQLFVDVLR